MLTNSCCTDPHTANSSDRRYFRNFSILHSSQRLREGARPEIVQDTLGHANIAVTQNSYATAGGKSVWMRSPQAVEAVTNAAHNAESEAKKNHLNPSATAVVFPLQVAIGESLVPRIRHCVECPNCHVLYLVSLSPYRNGAYLMPTIRGSTREYALYCSCRGGSAARLWRWSEMKACDVSKAAYDRGYGTRDEIVSIDVRPPECVDS